MATQTPMREVPGAFLATPAIAARNDRVSRQLFDTSRPSAGSRTSSSTALGVRMSSPRAGAMTSVTSGQGTDAAAPLPPLLKAAKSVKGVLQQDESYPDLDSVCRRKLLSLSAHLLAAFNPPLTSLQLAQPRIMICSSPTPRLRLSRGLKCTRSPTESSRLLI